MNQGVSADTLHKKITIMFVQEIVGIHIFGNLEVQWKMDAHFQE